MLWVCRALVFMRVYVRIQSKWPEGGKRKRKQMMMMMVMMCRAVARKEEMRHRVSLRVGLNPALFLPLAGCPNLLRLLSSS